MFCQYRGRAAGMLLMHSTDCQTLPLVSLLLLLPACLLLPATAPATACHCYCYCHCYCHLSIRGARHQGEAPAGRQGAPRCCCGAPRVHSAVRWQPQLQDHCCRPGQALPAVWSRAGQQTRLCWGCAGVLLWSESRGVCVSAGACLAVAVCSSVLGDSRPLNSHRRFWCCSPGLLCPFVSVVATYTQDCVIPLDPAGRSRGYGFVEVS
jgi:hypothetical protein